MVSMVVKISWVHFLSQLILIVTYLVMCVCPEPAHSKKVNYLEEKVP